MRGVHLLTGGHVSKLVLYDCEHLADGVENTSSELVLVIYGQPAAQHRRNFGFEHLGDLLANEGFLIQHSEVLAGFRALTETSVVLGRRGHLEEDILGVWDARRVQKVIGRVSIFSWVSLEAFQSF